MEGKTYDSGPSLIVATIFDHQIGTFIVLVDSSLSIGLPRWHHRHSVQWSVFPHGINDLFIRCSSQGFSIGSGYSFDGAVFV